MESRLFELVQEKDVDALRKWLKGEGRGVNPNLQNDQVSKDSCTRVCACFDIKN